MLAIVKSVERFHIYLYGLEFTVVTDCHALVYALNKVNINPRIARWTLKLQNYRFKIIHREGHRMAHVDALSRIVAFAEAMPLEKELQYKQLQDPKFKELSSKLEREDHHKFEFLDGLIFKKDPDKPRFAVPDSMINNIIRVYHDNNMAHCGLEKTIKGIQTNYWFPSFRKKVQNYLNNCLILLTNSAAISREGELQIADTPSQSFQVFHIDHFGPIQGSSNSFKHILVVIDSFSRFTWLFLTKSTGSKETIKHLSYLFQNFNPPVCLTEAQHLRRKNLWNF